MIFRHSPGITISPLESSAEVATLLFLIKVARRLTSCISTGEISSTGIDTSVSITSSLSLVTSRDVFPTLTVRVFSIVFGFV